MHFQRQNGFWLTVQVFLTFFFREKERQNKTVRFLWLLPLSMLRDAIFAVAHRWFEQCRWMFARLAYRSGLRSTTNARASTIHLKNWEPTNQQWQYFPHCVNCHLPSCLRTGSREGVLHRRVATSIERQRQWWWSKRAGNSEKCGTNKKKKSVKWSCRNHFTNENGVIFSNKK